jgi:hypothetical protein
MGEQRVPTTQNQGLPKPAQHIARELLKDGVYDTAAAEPVLRGCGAADYFQIDAGGLFRMYRP